MNEQTTKYLQDMSTAIGKSFSLDLNISQSVMLACLRCATAAAQQIIAEKGDVLEIHKVFNAYEHLIDLVKKNPELCEKYLKIK